MRSLFGKLKKIRLAYAQICLVVIAFALMVFVSYSYGREREQRHLQVNAEDKLTNAEAYINAHLQESQTVLAGMAGSVRIMLTNGEPIEVVRLFMTDITRQILSEESMLRSVDAVYGVFDCFDGQLIYNGKAPAPEGDLTESDWYLAAVEANGEVAVTAPQLEAGAEAYTLTYARRIFDDDNRPLGVICFDLTLEYVADFVINTRLTHDGYSLMLDGNLNVIAHPSVDFLGRGINLLNDGEVIAADMRSCAVFGKFDARSYLNERNELFWKVFDNGWVLCLMTPYDTYYRSITEMGWFLSILGAVMAAALCSVLLSITSAKVKSDEESRQKSNFLAMVSHEIRTPLNAIIGVTEIELLSDNLSPGLQESFSRIYSSAYSLLGIINDLLDLSKIEAGKLEIIPARYELASLINDVVHYNLVRANSRPVEFEVLVGETLPSIVIGDEIRVKQILNNLLSNAFKYTESGKVVLNAAAEYGEDGKLILVFTISDTGHGMTAEQIDRLFDEYSRFLTSTARGTLGTGLGMSITKRLLDLMDGSITVKSEMGSGSIFTVKIPQKDTSAGALGPALAERIRQFHVDAKTPALKESFSREYMPYGSVLIVDDMESNLYVAKGLLLPYGLAIDTALSGQEALAKIKSGRVYDLILMDYMMPGMDGIEAVQRIREYGYPNPIAALTANAMQGQAEMFLMRGFDEFISKPIDIRHLDLALNRLIRDRHPPETVEAARRQKKNAVKLPMASYAAELAKLFARDAGKTADTLQAILDRWNAPLEDDLALYIINVHAMKSALTNVGEADLSAVALRLEQAARERDLSVMAEETAAFIGELRAVIDKIKPKDEDAAADITDGDREFLRGQWAAIRDACLGYDKRTAKNALGELKKKAWPRAVKETLDAVSEHLLYSDFEEAAAVAGREAEDRA